MLSSTCTAKRGGVACNGETTRQIVQVRTDITISLTKDSYTNLRCVYTPMTVTTFLTVDREFNEILLLGLVLVEFTNDQNYVFHATRRYVIMPIHAKKGATTKRERRVSCLLCGNIVLVPTDPHSLPVSLLCSCQDIIDRRVPWIRSRHDMILNTRTTHGVLFSFFLGAYQ